MARNTAHSNGYRGFFFGDELTWDQDFANSETNQCDPREDPLDKWSPSVSNLVQDLTLYKNMQMGLWNDCKNVVYDGLKISDTPFAMVASHTPCTVQNSLFIGESGNLGEPNEVRLRNGTKVMWHRYLQTINQKFFQLKHYVTGPLPMGSTIKGQFLVSTSMTATSTQVTILSPTSMTMPTRSLEQSASRP